MSIKKIVDSVVKRVTKKKVAVAGAEAPNRVEFPEPVRRFNNGDDNQFSPERMQGK